MYSGNAQIEQTKGVRNPMALRQRGNEILLPQHLARSLPELQEQANERNPMAYLHFQLLTSHWFAMEWDRDDTFFGLIHDDAGREPRLDFFYLSDLSQIWLPSGSIVQRDTRFRPTRLSDIRRRLQNERYQW